MAMLKKSVCVCVWGGGGDSHMKGVGILVVSFRGLNLGCRSHLRCSGQNVIVFSREGLVEGCTRRNIKLSIQYLFHM